MAIPTVAVRIEKCQHCKHVHDDLSFANIPMPVEARGHKWTWVALCPETERRIFLRYSVGGGEPGLEILDGESRVFSYIDPDRPEGGKPPAPKVEDAPPTPETP